MAAVSLALVVLGAACGGTTSGRPKDDDAEQGGNTSTPRRRQRASRRQPLEWHVRQRAWHQPQRRGGAPPRGASADTSRQPWVVWPDRADGVGIVRVSAVTDAYTFLDKTTVPDASFVEAAAVYGVPLCVAPGSAHVRAYLDDNEDEDPNQPASSDYLDSCFDGGGQCFRCLDVNVSAGAVADVAISLAQSCD